MDPIVAEKIARIARTLWYIDYRRWDMATVFLINARTAMMNESYTRIDAETGAKHCDRPEDARRLDSIMPIFSMLGKRIENGYARTPEFDRFYFYHQDAWRAAKKVIDREGIAALRKELTALCQENGVSMHELQELAALPNFIPGMFDQLEFTADGEKVLLPEFPTVKQLWDVMESGGEFEVPEPYIFQAE